MRDKISKRASVKDSVKRGGQATDITRLASSNEELQTTFDALNDMIMLLDSDHKIIRANKVTADFLKLPLDKIIGEYCFKLIHGTNRPIMECPVERMLKSKNHEEEDLYFEETGMWAQVMAHPITNKKGNLVRIVHVIRDITERKKTAEKLEHISHLNRLILDSAGEGILGLDIQGNHTFINLTAAKMLGYQVDELIGTHSHSTWHYKKSDGSPYPKEECPIYETLKDGAIHRINNEVFWKKDGTNFPVEYSSMPIQEEGKVVGTVVVFNDVTERKQAEKLLLESEHRYHSLFEDSKDAIYVTTRDGRFLDINQSTLNVFGYTREEMMALRVVDIYIGPADRIRFQRDIERTGSVKDYEMKFRKKDGSEMDCLITSTIWKNNVGEIGGYRGIMRDITAHKQAEEKIQQASEELIHTVNRLEVRNRQSILLSEMREMLQACSTVEEVSPIVRGSVEKLFPDVEGALFMMSPSRSDLESVVRWGDFPEDVDDNVFAPDACWALRRGRVHVVEKVSIGPICPHLKHPPSTAYVCLPLVAKGDVLGLLHLRSRQSVQLQGEQSFISELKEIAVTISEYLSLSIANIKLSESLARQAIRDPLTGLFNRRYMEESLQREIMRAERKQTQVGIIMMDIDHFKQFNDSYGHAAGDKLLAQMGDFFKTRIRGADVACRYGGEEFIVFLPESSAENTYKRADQMREEVKNLEVHYRDQLLAAITLSMGISTYPDQGRNAEGLLRVADVALYKAKQEGRDRVIIGSFDPVP